jgi:hypothetical protein
VAGSDLSHLNNPLSIWHDRLDERVYIADTGNSRILAVDFSTSPPTVKRIWLHANVRGIRMIQSRYWSPKRWTRAALITDEAAQPLTMYINDL